MQHVDSLDRTVFLWWNGLAGRNGFVDTFAVLSAQYAIFVAAGLMVVLWFALPRTALAMRRQLLYAGLAALLAIGVNYVIGLIWFRPRPFVVYPHLVHQLVQHVADASFPSDHAAVAAAVAFAMRGQSRPVQFAFWLLTVLIVLSRVFVGVHWPSDVLGGVAVGFITSAAILACSGYLRRPADAVLRIFHLHAPYEAPGAR